mmetsp:Transcript_47200/g.113422  ORF Transcript_47200/g.113422 Transcript_47200/m.113422 type:complete len:116 (+) Transcript_47200:98-445(+)
MQCHNPINDFYERARNYARTCGEAEAKQLCWSFETSGTAGKSVQWGLVQGMVQCMGKVQGTDELKDHQRTCCSMQDVSPAHVLMQHARDGDKLQLMVKERPFSGCLSRLPQRTMT